MRGTFATFVVNAVKRRKTAQHSRRMIQRMYYVSASVFLPKGAQADGTLNFTHWVFMEVTLASVQTGL